MSVKRISIVVFIFAVFGACKKTKLEGDLSFLIGTWDWKYTVKTEDVCDPFPYDSVITNSPSIDGYSYSLTFEKKGKLIVKKSGEKNKKYRLVYKNKVVDLEYVTYIFYLNNKKDKLVGFTYRDNSPSRLETTSYPDGLINIDGCQGIHSVFEKIQ